MKRLKRGRVGRTRPRLYCTAAVRPLVSDLGQCFENQQDSSSWRMMDVCFRTTLSIYTLLLLINNTSILWLVMWNPGELTLYNYKLTFIVSGEMF